MIKISKILSNLITGFLALNGWSVDTQNISNFSTNLPLIIINTNKKTIVNNPINLFL